MAYTKQNTRIGRLQSDPVYSGPGSSAPTAVPFQAFMANKILVNDSDAADVQGLATWQQVNFDLLDAALTSTNITAAGKTVSYPQLAALIRQAILDRANAQGVS